MTTKKNKKAMLNTTDADEVAEVKNSNLFLRLGTQIRKMRDLEIKAAYGKKPDPNMPKLPPGDYRCYVFESDPVKADKILLKDTITLSLPVLIDDQFKSDPVYNLIGYDTEYEEDKTSHATDPVDWGTETLDEKHKRFKLLSHQFWFNLRGVRFGVVYLTDKRFTQRQFIELLGAVLPPQQIPKGEDPEKKRIGYVYSYFSLIESGWMRLGKPNMKLKKKLLPTEKHVKLWDVRNNKNNKSKNVDPTKRPCAVIKEKGRSWEGDCEIHDGVSSLVMSDAGNFVAGGLHRLGKEIGIDKIELTEDEISKMSQFKEDDFDKFIRYGINDSVIAAEAHNFYKNTTREVLKLAVPNAVLKNDATKDRITGYSAHVFSTIYKELFGKSWKLLLGYEKIGRKLKQTIMHRAFTKHYYGGRNDVFEVGPRGAAYYHDLHSAYPTAVAMLGDFDFSKHTRWGAESAEDRVEEWIKKDNPFLPFGLTLAFVFHDKLTAADGTVKEVRPIFPCRIDDSESMPGVKNSGGCDGLLFPRTGVTSVTWPEYWVARKSGLLKRHMILEFVEFAPHTGRDGGSGQQTYNLSQVMHKLLKFRAAGSGATKSYIKSLTNFFYGLTSTGVADASKVIKTHDEGIKTKSSSVTCYPLGAYITGFCRAIVGELLQKNDCYAITTDGFISPQKILVQGELCRMVGREFRKVRLRDEKGRKKLFINVEKSGDRSIFTKTRGYMLLQGDVPTKIAAQGAQVREAGETTEKSAISLLDQLQRGWANKLYWPELSEVRKIQAKDPDFVPYKMCREYAKIDMTFDFKHKPVIDVEKKGVHWIKFRFRGKKYRLMSFKTVPLEAVNDFHVIRTLSKRRDYMRKYRNDLLKQCNAMNKRFGQPGMFTKEKDFEHIVEAEQETKMYKPWMQWDDYVTLMSEYAKYGDGRQYMPEPAEITGDEDIEEDC